MNGYVLQDWLNVKGSTADLFVQDSEDWLDLTGHQDVVIWLDVRRMNPPSGGSLTWKLQTAPTKDHVLFQDMATKTDPSIGLTTPLLTVLLSAQPSVPLSRWVRWGILPNGAGSWEATFRVLLAGNELSASLGGRSYA